MMKLSTMKKVVDTVNQEWRSPIAEKILENWGYDEGTVCYFRASANFVFIFKKKEKTYFLRFTDSVEKNLSLLEAEMEILEYLRDQPIRSAQPVKSLNQRIIEVVETEIGTYYAVVFEALPGKQFEIEELQLDQFFQWGRALGKLHFIFKDIPEKYRSNRESWKDQLISIQEFLPEQEIAAMREWNVILARLETLKQSDGNFGLIHYDLELDNQRWDDQIVGIMDFDDCINHWFVADIAFALRDLFTKKIDLQNPFFQEFLKGYQRETELDASLLSELPLFQRMHNLVTFAKLLHTVDIPEMQDQPVWLANLRSKLLNKLEDYRNSFLNL